MATKLKFKCHFRVKKLLHKKVQNVSFLETFRRGRNDVISSKTKG